MLLGTTGAEGQVGMTTREGDLTDRDILTGRYADDTRFEILVATLGLGRLDLPGHTDMRGRECRDMAVHLTTIRDGEGCRLRQVRVLEPFSGRDHRSRSGHEG